MLAKLIELLLRQLTGCNRCDQVFIIDLIRNFRQTQNNAGRKAKVLCTSWADQLLTHFPRQIGRRLRPQLKLNGGWHIATHSVFFSERAVE